MNILIVTNLYPGYPEQPNSEIPHVVHYYARRWCELGHHVKVARIWPRYWPWVTNLLSKEARILARHATRHKFLLDGVDVFRFPVKKLPAVDYFDHHIRETAREIVRVMGKVQNEESFSPEIILCHALNPQGFIAQILHEEFQIPMVTVLHTVDIKDLHRKNTFVRRCRRLMPSVAALGFRSPEIGKNYRLFMKDSESMDASEQREFVIPSGIESAEILSREEFINKSARPISVINLTANLIPRKHADSLLYAFARVCERYDIRLRILGDGPERDKLINLSRALQVDNRVDFPGYMQRDAVLREMEGAELFVLISSKETFGLVYVEAMAKGCIVVGSRDEGIQGTIEHGKNGFLCAAGDTDELERLLRHILQMEEMEKKELLLNARCTALELTQEQLAEEYLNILRSCV